MSLFYTCCTALLLSICHGQNIIVRRDVFVDLMELFAVLLYVDFYRFLFCDSAFDPAHPGFDGPNARRRLTKSDAKFVDVIHTNARVGLSNAVGIETPLGHADFYPNGGSRMPGCIGFSFQTSKNCIHSLM